MFFQFLFTVTSQPQAGYVESHITAQNGIAKLLPSLAITCGMKYAQGPLVFGSW
jgi:hypothetical protein